MGEQSPSLAVLPERLNLAVQRSAVHPHYFRGLFESEIV